MEPVANRVCTYSASPQVGYFLVITKQMVRVCSWPKFAPGKKFSPGKKFASVDYGGYVACYYKSIIYRTDRRLCGIN